MTLLTKQQLENLTTKRLLAYKNKLMQVPESPPYEEDNVNRLNKLSPEWKECYATLKDILATRKNVIK